MRLGALAAVATTAPSEWLASGRANNNNKSANDKLRDCIRSLERAQPETTCLVAAIQFDETDQHTRARAKFPLPNWNSGETPSEGGLRGCVDSGDDRLIWIVLAGCNDKQISESDTSCGAIVGHAEIVLMFSLMLLLLFLFLLLSWLFLLCLARHLMVWV